MNVDKIKEFCITKKATIAEALDNDRKYIHDPFIGQHMRGRISVEEQAVADLEKILQMIDE